MFTTRLRGTGSLPLSAALLLGMLPSILIAQQDDPMAPDPDPQAVIHEIKHSHERMEMVVNSSRILKLDQKIPKAVVNNPELLDVTPLSPTEIQLFAKKAGVTQVNIWGEDQKIRAVDIIVFADAQELAMLLKHQFPNASLRVIPLANSVVISGYLDDADQVDRIIQMAEDFHPKVINNIRIGGVQQVLLHVKVLEVARTKLRAAGFDFSQFGTNDFAVSGISGLVRATGEQVNTASNMVQNLPEVGASAAGAAMGGIPTGSVGSFVFGVMNGTNSFFGFLDFLRRHDMLKIMAEPNLVCVSGRPAFFNSGGEFPIIVPQSLGTVSVQYKKYGTQLDFVPIVLGNGNIRLEVKPRVSEIDNTRTVVINNNTVPALKTREAETGVEMQPGQTLAIAGLVYNRQESFSQGIPFLADLPYIGVAFRRNRQEEQEVELLILVTPQLVEPLDPCEVPCGGPGTNSATPNDCQFYIKGHLEVGTDAELAPGAGAGQYPPHCPPPPETFGPGHGDCPGGVCPDGPAYDGLPPGAVQGPEMPGTMGPEAVEEVSPEPAPLPGPAPAARRSQPAPRRSVARQGAGGNQSSRGRVVKVDSSGAERAVRSTDGAQERRGGSVSAGTSRPVVRSAPVVHSAQSTRPARLEAPRDIRRVSNKPGFIGPTGYDVRN